MEVYNQAGLTINNAVDTEITVAVQPVTISPFSGLTYGGIPITLSGTGIGLGSGVLLIGGQEGRLANCLISLMYMFSDS